MKITPNTLFHFTNSRLKLEGILENKFKVSYCKESFKLGKSNSGDFYFPMISFCDIPLASAKDHIKKYGYYGIGMTKEWGIKNKLNPVLYLEINSMISNQISNQLNHINKSLMYLESFLTSDEKILKVRSEDISSMLKHFKKIINGESDLYRYIKNYEGDLIRGTKVYKNYRFYDEQEWRFVPDFYNDNVQWRMNKKEYNKYRGKGKSKPFLDSPILEFDSEDVRHIIVKNPSDIPKLIRKIKSIDHLCRSSDFADILITKIITVDSLDSDF